MRILVTGGRGLHRLALRPHATVRRLSRLRGRAVTVLDKLTYAGNLANLDPVRAGFEFVRGDICDAALLATWCPDTTRS